MTVAKSANLNSRAMLIMAAEELMRESGYAAVTSRRVAAKAGLKPQLVHYYFATMDDLLLEVYRELATGLMERQKKIMNAKKPLTKLWKLTTDARGLVLYEFIALANHRPALRKEFADFGDRFRRGQIEIMKQILANADIKGFPWSAEFSAVLLNCLARGLAIESEVGMSEGHAQSLKIIMHFIKKLDR